MWFGMNKEKDVLSGVRERLKIYEFHKVVLWHERMNSGKVKTEFGTWVQMAVKGTPDVVAVVRNKQGGISLLFFELKSDTGTLRPEQKEFRDRFIGCKDVMYAVITDPKQIDTIISDIGIDHSLGLPEDI